MNNNSNIISKDLEIAIKAAKIAGKIIKKNYTKIKYIIQKDINDFVTDTDLEVEKVIIDILKHTGYSILSEEIGEINNISNKKWIIDPIDGTSNFINNINFFAISIALIENNTDILLGVIYNPIDGQCYWAEKKCGAFFNGNKITVNEIHTNNSVVLVEHGKNKYHKLHFLKAINKIITQQNADILRQGATALMLCNIANGNYGAFISCGDEIYDYAAGLIIAQEANAIISDWNGGVFCNKNSYILVSNKNMYNTVLKSLKGIQINQKSNNTFNHAPYNL